jgi:hypothetical protein
MILEINRMVADWFSDATNGVNAVHASTPIDTGDTRPANFATVTDETRDANVARGELPASLPAVSVAVDVIKNLDGQVCTVTADGRVKLRIRVGVENSASANGIRDLSYYMRSVRRSFRRFMATDASSASRTRNSVYLESCLEMDEAIAPVKDQAGNTIISGYLFPVIQVRELAP